MFDREIFRDRLRDARITRGLSKRALASAIGKSEVAIGQYEKTEGNGERDYLPTLESLYALACALGVTPDYLLGFSDAAPAPVVSRVSPDYVRLTATQQKLLEAAEGLSREQLREVVTFMQYLGHKGAPAQQKEKAPPKERGFEALIPDPKEPVPDEVAPLPQEPHPESTLPRREGGSPPSPRPRRTR